MKVIFNRNMAFQGRTNVLKWNKRIVFGVRLFFNERICMLNQDNPSVRMKRCGQMDLRCGYVMPAGYERAGKEGIL